MNLTQAADRAAELLRKGQKGLALTIASSESGYPTATIASELLKRRKAKKAAQEARNKPVHHWQDTERD